MIDDKNRVLVHSPADLASEHLAWAESIQQHPGITFGLPAIDRYVVPMRPGNLVCFIGRPGHAKTSLLAYLARLEAQRIVARGAEGEVVVYVTWEQSAEELEAFFQADGEYSISDIMWGRVELDKLRKRAIKRAGLPIWIIGHSIGRAGMKAPRMTIDAVLGAIETMEADYEVKPVLMLFDYMQLIPSKSYKDRVQQVTEVPILVKELALRLGVPAAVGVQARREVDDRREKIPELRDAQWAASIEQTADKVFGLWRPVQTEKKGAVVSIEGGHDYPVTDNLIVLRMLKQRGDVGRRTWGLYFDMACLKLAEMELNAGGLYGD